MASLDRAIAIAVEAHSGICDKSGQAYILHPLRVMMAMTTDALRCVAVLHDVIEDVPDWTLERLRSEGFLDEVVTGVDAVTRRNGEDYMDFVRRASCHPLGRIVKQADILDNMDITRLKQISERDVERLRKYRAALDILLAED